MAVADTLPVGVTIADCTAPDAPIQFVNDAFVALTGYPKSEVLGRNCRFLQGPRTERAAVARLREAVLRRAPAKETLVNYKKDGTPFWNELSLTPVFGDAGGIEAYVGLQLDVTAREQHATVLEESRALNVALEHARIAVEGRRRFTETLLHTLSSAVIAANKAGLITFANAAAMTATELRYDELLGASLPDLFKSQEFKRALSAPNHAEVRLEFPYEAPSGRVLEMGMSLIHAARDGIPELAFLVVFRDIGYRRQLEIEMRRVRGLSALGQMAAGFAHEIRNPIAAIHAACDALNAELGPQDPRSEYTVRMASLVKRVERLIKSSLHFAQPSSPEPRVCDPRQLVDAALEVLKPKVPDVTALTRQDDAGTKDAYVDSDQLVEVLVILIDNALDATGSPAQVSLRTRMTELALGAGQAKRCFVAIDVVDHGPGIPLDNQALVFEPFFTTRARGTGLGLSIAQRLMRENAGHLLLTSRPGLTTFTALLPCAS